MALRSNVEEAWRLCREALAATERTEDSFGRSGALHVLAVAVQMAGDFLEARELMTVRIALARGQGNFAVVSLENGNLSIVERQLGNLEQADALAREALAIDSQRGEEWAMPYQITAIAAVATERREFAHAATLVGAAESLMEARGAACPPDERPHYERMVVALTEAMGVTEFNRFRAAGHSMS